MAEEKVAPSYGLVALALGNDRGESTLGPNVSNDSNVTKTRQSRAAKPVDKIAQGEIGTPVENIKDSNLKREQRSSEVDDRVGPLPNKILAGNTDANLNGVPQDTSQDMEDDEEVVDDDNYGVGFNPGCIVGDYGVSGQIELSNGRVMEPDLRGRIRSAAKLASAMGKFNGEGFVPKTNVYNWEAATANACNGYVIPGTKLHPLEMANCMVKCCMDNPTGTPNAQEIGYLATIVRDLEESRNLQGDYLRHLEVECSNACGQLKFTGDDIYVQLAKLSDPLAAIETGVKGLQKSHDAHTTFVNQCKNQLWSLQNASVTGTSIGNRMSAGMGPNLALGQSSTVQRSVAPKRRIDMGTSQNSAQPKRVHTVRVGSEMTTPLNTPQLAPPVIFKPNKLDIVIVLDDPSDPFSGFYPWQVDVHGKIFECILNGMIYAEAIACAPAHMSSMAKALNGRFGQNDGTKWSADFHEYKRELMRVWTQVERHVETMKIDVAEKWFKMGDGRDSDSGQLYECREDATDTVAYATLKTIIQNAVDNNAGLRSVIFVDLEPLYSLRCDIKTWRLGFYPITVVHEPTELLSGQQSHQLSTNSPYCLFITLRSMETAYEKVVHRPRTRLSGQLSNQTCENLQQFLINPLCPKEQSNRLVVQRYRVRPVGQLLDSLHNLCYTSQIQNARSLHTYSERVVQRVPRCAVRQHLDLYLDMNLLYCSQLLWSSGNARGPNGWVQTNRVIRCAGEFPPMGWHGALMCGGIKGKLECAIPTSHGPYYLAPFMNLYGTAWMDVRSTITEEAAFSHRTDSGEIEQLADEGLFAAFDDAKQWDARDSGNVYATVQANLIAPETYIEKQRNNATLRRGFMPAILESVAKPQSQNASNTANRGNNKNTRGSSQQRGTGRGRGNGAAPKPKTAYQKMQRVFAALREPVIASEQVVVAESQRLSENRFRFDDQLAGDVEQGGGQNQAGERNDEPDVVLCGENDVDEGAGRVDNGGGLRAPADGSYAGHAQASVAATLRTSQLHAKLSKQGAGRGRGGGQAGGIMRTPSNTLPLSQHFARQQ